MRGFKSPAAGYLLTCGLVAASLVLAVLADSKLGAPPVLGGSDLGTPAQARAAGDASVARQWRETPATEPVVVLTAAIVGRTPATSLALVAVNEAPAIAVRPGDMLPGGYRVLALETDAMTYQAGERQVRVRLQDGARSLPAQASAVMVTQVGSSRVDLQACKLEYSIVSPK